MRRFLTLLGSFAVPACSGTFVSPPFPAAMPPSPAPQKIQHVVIIVQENRSFNNLFYGFPGADTAGYGYTSHGNRIKLQPVGLATTWDLDHSSYSFFAACNGTGKYPGTHCRMNGFDNEYVGCGHSRYPPCPIKYPPYAYVPQGETRPYFDIAKQYVLGDRMFASNFDASSFISHQYIIAGQASSAVNYPRFSWGCEGGPQDTIGTVTRQRSIYGGYIRACFENQTLGDELDNAGITWGFYAAYYSAGYVNLWSAYQAIGHIYYGPDWHKDVLPNTSFFDDVRHGRMRSVSWITPTCANSDHAGCGSNTGPSWVASLINAVGRSKYWNTTAIFVFWDDYGGWYDRVAPQLVDYDGLGLRLPLLVVSPYAKRGYISHVRYEHGSILKFIEDLWGLPRLAASDTRANSPAADCFDFTRAPRRFVPISAPHGEDYFRSQAPDARIPDEQ